MKNCGIIAAFLVSPLIFIIVYDVITRKFPVVREFTTSVGLYDYITPTKLQEMQWHLHGAIFLLCFGYCYLKNAHVRVDVFRDAVTVRKKAVIELLGIILLSTPFLVLLIYFGFGFVSTSYTQGESSSALTGLSHRWIMKSILVFGIFIFLLATFSTAIRLLLLLFGNEDVRQTAKEQLGLLLDAEGEG